MAVGGTRSSVAAGTRCLFGFGRDAGVCWRRGRERVAGDGGGLVVVFRKNCASLDDQKGYFFSSASIPAWATASSISDLAPLAAMPPRTWPSTMIGNPP